MKVIEADVKYLSNLLRYMHQSIFQLCGPPQTPPPPSATAGYLPAFSVLGVGHLQISIMTKILTHPCLNLVN